MKGKRRQEGNILSMEATKEEGSKEEL